MQDHMTCQHNERAIIRLHHQCPCHDHIWSSTQDSTAIPLCRLSNYSAIPLLNSGKGTFMRQVRAMDDGAIADCKVVMRPHYLC